MSAARIPQVALIPGDGVGPEVTDAAVAVLQASGVELGFSRHQAGDDCLAATGEALPAATLAAALAADAVLFGAVGKSAAQVILRLRRELGTYQNLRPAKAYPGVECLQPATDLMIVRENTECLYLGIEAQVAPGVVTATRVITAEASLRIARAAFAWAKANGRTQVTAVHKNNVLIQSDGLFLEGCRQAAAEHPEIAYEEALVDSAAMHLVLDPARFQVMVTTNMFGDILSDLAAGLIGGLGLCPSANLGEAGALFEPVHGSAPDIAGQGVANPAAAIGCAAMLLAHLGHAQAARRVEGALARALASGRTTRDLGGKLGTMEMAREVAGLMA